MTSGPARPRTLLDFINRPILKGVAPAGNLKRVFTGKSGQKRKKILGELCMRQKLFKTAKTPTGHIDTLMSAFLLTIHVEKQEIRLLSKLKCSQSFV